MDFGLPMFGSTHHEELGDQIRCACVFQQYQMEKGGYIVLHQKKQHWTNIAFGAQTKTRKHA